MKVDIVIPIYNAYEDVVACVNSVIRHTDISKNYLLLINDKSTDARIMPFLLQTAENNKALNIIVQNNQKNLGFVGSVNWGMKYSDHDVVLLNSDTIVTKRWLDKLQHCAYDKKCIASVTPLSNNATLASVPDFLVENELPSNSTLDEYADIIEQTSMKQYPEIPTANGFCMYIRREAINIVGVFDEEVFGKGYGEENDFCYRCLQVGLRHLLCDDTFIYHKGSQSFNEEKKLLLEQHLDIIKNKYPDFYVNTEFFLQKNPIFPIHANVRYGYETSTRPNILILVHTYQDPPIGNVGGTSMHVYDLVKNLVDRYNFHVLHYSEHHSAYFIISYFRNSTVTNYVGQYPKYTSPRLYNNAFREDLNKMLNLLHIDIIHIHHLLNLYLDVFKLADERKIPVVFSAHDYYMLCPSITLMNIDKKPCNLNATKDCKRCIRERYDTKGDFMTLWQKECHSCLKSAKKIITPSQTAKDVFLSFYKDLDINVIEHGYKPSKEIHLNHNTDIKKFNIAFIGGISETKGLSYLKGLKEKTAGTNIMIHLFGVTADSMANVSSKNFIYHGQYDRNELLRNMLENNIKLVCLFSIWAETFSYTLSESLLAGIPVITLDIGAIAERVRKIDAGWIMPYESSVDDIYQTIENIRSNSIDYIRKVEHIRKYLKTAKSTEEMSKEYAAIYDKLMEKFPVEKHLNGNVAEKLMFFQNLRSPLMINENNMFSLRTEYVRLKNLVIKGDAPISVVMKEVNTFRSHAQGSHLRNKILYKLIWYRFIHKYLMMIAYNTRKMMKRIFH